MTIRTTFSHRQARSMGWNKLYRMYSDVKSAQPAMHQIGSDVFANGHANKLLVEIYNSDLLG